jgi:hypothetical protein
LNAFNATIVVNLSESNSDPWLYLGIRSQMPTGHISVGKIIFSTYNYDYRGVVMRFAMGNIGSGKADVNGISHPFKNFIYDESYTDLTIFNSFVSRRELPSNSISIPHAEADLPYYDYISADNTITLYNPNRNVDDVRATEYSDFSGSDASIELVVGKVTDNTSRAYYSVSSQLNNANILKVGNGTLGSGYIRVTGGFSNSLNYGLRSEFYPDAGDPSVTYTSVAQGDATKYLPTTVLPENYTSGQYVFKLLSPTGTLVKTVTP